MPLVLRGNATVYDYLVVGAGLAGSTIAERLATTQDATVLVVDRRDHVAGNAHDDAFIDGLQYHAYGPHIFHTNSQRVVDYLSQFTSWRPYEHRVLSRVAGKLVPMPINRTTINRLFDTELDEAGIERFLNGRAERFPRIDNSEQMIRSRIGTELYRAFFRGYTRKQWGRDPSQLDASVCGRIPTRTGDDDRYFSDDFQAMPSEGYTAMVRRMLDQPTIDVRLGVDYRDVAKTVQARHTVFTGPIDEYYKYRYGRLPYRSLSFEFETVPVPQLQEAACINEPDEQIPYTRTTEYKFLTGQRAPRTIVSREYPGADGDPFYPIPCAESRELYQRYATLAKNEANVTFAGRLGEYKYFNMDQVVASALGKVETLARNEVA
ncbi:MAG: UDP-galactopyranose mutase [Candidatus Eremiobacteraeota bacterium]|nr:UDP-galactopyranose mutase [Candidatus Eremiobacteraeota bacterium]